jgi:hypothetical protein
MQKLQFLTNQNWVPALVFTLVFAAFYMLFFGGIFIR